MVLGNFTSYFQKFSELLRGFDQLVPHFAEYQRLFPDSERLRRATYEFQTTIIRCCSQMILATRRSWQNQLLAAMSQSFQTEIQPIVDDVTGHKWDSLLEDLSNYDYTAAFKSARSKRHNGTAEWVFGTAEFASWYGKDASAVLHLVGKIGSGKTVLAASIVDHLILSRHQTSQGIAFFFVRFDDSTSQHHESIIRSIIRQVLNHGPSYTQLLQLLEVSSNQFFDNDSLVALWSAGIKSFEDFFLVIDAFDECTLADRKTILKILSTLSRACQGTTKLKILLSSRGSVTEEINQLDIAVIRMAADERSIRADLTKYAEEILNDKISTRELVFQDETLFNSILQAVSIGGEGMFLWVFLTIEDICSQTNDAEIRESLKHIPRKLAETFEHALQRIMSNGKTSIAQDIFNWTATVRQPLTLDQLQESLAVKVGQSHSEPERYPNNIARLTMWCENLVYVEETEETDETDET
ncbi:nacht domain protein, partial [Colletotrichum asianum]